MTLNRPSIRLAISTCPNDTFAFHGLMTNAVDSRGLRFEFELLDIQQLNDRMFSGDFDIAKGSFHAALLLANACYVLPSGSALGFGVGPLLLAAKAGTAPEPGDAQVTLCPGAHTTAALLFHMFYSGRSRVEHALFSEIMPSLREGCADFGVCIHEGRFTYEQEGLSLVEDLGTRWEQTTNCPLPLGGIFANRKLEQTVIARAQAAIRDSINFGLRQPEVTLPTMRRYAQAFNDEVLMQHVQLYVNEWTQDLGDQGRQAIDSLSQLATTAGIIPAAQRLEIFGARST